LIELLSGPWFVFNAQHDPWSLNNKVYAPLLLGKHFALDNYYVTDGDAR